MKSGKILLMKGKVPTERNLILERKSTRWKWFRISNIQGNERSSNHRLMDRKRGD